MSRRVESSEYLTQNEMGALLTAAEKRAESGELSDRMLYVSIVFALHTGLRKGELFALRWGQDVDVKTKRLTVVRSFRGLGRSSVQRHWRV